MVDEAGLPIGRKAQVRAPLKEWGNALRDLKKENMKLVLCPPGHS
jgi:hypothetical protein